MKTIHRGAFAEVGLRSDFAEAYYSVSRASVLRGMHCQAAPYEHSKLVYCVVGRVLDVTVDLRREGPRFGAFAVVELSAASGNMVYIPPGFAHGFLVLEEQAIVAYHVTSEHEPTADMGVRWDSFGFEWPVREPVVSARDAALPSLTEFRGAFSR